MNGLVRLDGGEDSRWTREGVAWSPSPSSTYAYV